MKNYFAVLVISLLIFSCSGKNKIPGNILRQKEMVSVLWDLFRADEFLTSYVLRPDSAINKKTESVGYYEEIFRLHNTNREQFQKSFSFYESHPVLMKQLLDSLNAKGSNADREIGRPVIRDSIPFHNRRPALID
ncbi:MAG: hypothetical protein B6D37_09180 [Sphingobacteriales bacterium UTBCD1]|jgi:hypothetical protein|nr:MAG: hypothetical protein B6D37_09180 [Sphingobacteriales bacterium UTBCD1]